MSAECVLALESIYRIHNMREVNIKGKIYYEVRLNCSLDDSSITLVLPYTAPMHKFHLGYTYELDMFFPRYGEDRPEFKKNLSLKNLAP